MHALTVPGEKDAQLGAVVKRLQQLDGCQSRPEERDPHVRKTLLATKLEPECGLKVQSGVVDRTHGPADVVDHRHVSRARPAAWWSWLTSPDGHEDSMARGR